MAHPVWFGRSCLLREEGARKGVQKNMSSASQGVEALAKPQRSFVQRSGWLLLIVGLTIISAAVQLAAGGVTIIGVLFEPLLIGLMFLLPRRFPALPVLAEKTRAQVRAETRPLLGYALLFPPLLVPVVIWGYFQNLPLFLDRTTYWALFHLAQDRDPELASSYR